MYPLLMIDLGEPLPAPFIRQPAQSLQSTAVWHTNAQDLRRPVS